MCAHASILAHVHVFHIETTVFLHGCYGILIVCLFLLHLGVLCLLRMCGIHLRHHLPPLHPRPMAVFRCQHLRMGPVCLAHRLVQVFCGLSASQIATFTSKTGCMRESQLPCFFSARPKSADFFFFSFFFSCLLLSHRERSLSTNCITVDPVCVHRSCHTVQRSEELSRRPVSTLCCSLVNIFCRCPIISFNVHDK